MKFKSISLLNQRLSRSLFAAAVCLTLPLAVYADNTVALSLETAKLDTAQPGQSETSTIPDKSQTLYGGVTKHDHLLGGSNNFDLGTSKTDANLQTEKPASDAASLYRLAVQKLQTGQELTSDEFRSLGAGCAGYESNRTFFQPIAKVSVVYRDSPAAKAGLRKGDKLLDVADDKDAKADPSIPRWSISCGQEGTTVELTVLRHGQQFKLSMIRWNIEDIKEADKRQLWEDTVRQLGYPKGGTYSGTNMNDLHLVSN